jgi:hypothetical protein
VITTCFSIGSPMSKEAQDWNLLLETMTSLVVPASGEACTTKVQFSADYPLVQLLRFAIATIPFC